MGTKARCVMRVFLALALVASASTAAGAPRRAPGVRPVITGGLDQKSAWLVAEYRNLHIRKQTDRATLAVEIELRTGADLVRISLSPQSLAVSRQAKRVVIDSPEALASVQSLLGDSPAVFAARLMLSELEPVSALTAPDMSLLSTAALVASIVGDVGAPLRIADRFMEKHRGIFRQVRANGDCWGSYSAEVSDAWDDLQACMDDADQKDFIRAAYERLACNAVWLLRSESAWFEYLKCLSPLSAIAQ